MKTHLIWYRNDLRMGDYPPLKTIETEAETSQLIPLYCFDPRQFTTTSFGFPKTGSFRAQFLLESLTDLRKSWRSHHSNLVILRGLPEEIIPALVKKFSISTVHFHQEVTAEEIAVEKALKKALTSLQVEIKTYTIATLFHPKDLPFHINYLPEIFTQFRKKIEKSASVRPPVAIPQKLPPLPNIAIGEIPNLESLGLQPTPIDSKAVLPFQGGETAGKARLAEYFWEKDLLRSYKKTRNGMLGADYSSKFSPWLASGSLSPRYIYAEVKKYEEQRVANDSTYWLIFELLWRDYFRFICAKHGDRIFYKFGLQGINIPWQEDWQRFHLWREGKTGFPLVDANMRELAATGFMSNRGRQNVASFLTKNLGINWQMGAEWFESVLIDYDVCSNWGNWNYVAGVGNDARGFRYFNILKQSKDYDPQGKYVKHWLPELQEVPVNQVHQPWQLSPEEQKRCGVMIGVDYPHPVVDLAKSVQANEKIYNTGISRNK